MRLASIKGNPQIEAFSSVSAPEIQKELKIPSGTPFAHVSSSGKALVGPTFWNTWVELAGVRVAVLPEQRPWPFFSLGELHYQLWRSRVFYFNPRLLQRALIEPLKLDLGKPSVPFAEVLWSPGSGIQKSLRGLEHLKPNDLVGESAALVRILRHWTTFTKVGRPAESTEQFRARLRSAAEELTSSGQRLSNPHLAKAMNVDLRWLQRLIKRHVQDWPALKATLERSER